MFGAMNVMPVLDLRSAREEIANRTDRAVARLLELTDQPRIERWVQFPKALLVFLVVAGDPESGAVYVYDRRAKVWYWIDFDDTKFGGYSIVDFDHLVRECHFLDIVEHLTLLVEKDSWIVEDGARPRSAS
ncbi:MAG TPA: hypothetical protein VFW94_09370 [Candidatus Acidoferrales bacterium]|nr:hypothetical protein [Candidatus Acidoferrales bacterium]